MEEYLAKREKLLKEINDRKFSGLSFTPQEEAANETFKNMLLKEKQQLKGNFFQRYTLQYKQQIEESNCFKVIRMMPKGATLHIHFDTANDVEWFFQNLAYLPTTFYNQSNLRFRYFKNEKVAEPGYVMLSKLRDQHTDKHQFEADIKKRLQITEQEAHDQKADIWQIFEQKIQAMWQLILHKDYFKHYLYRVFQVFYNDGIYRIEARALLHSIFDDDLNPLPLDEEYQVYQEVINRAKKEIHPQFSYATIIQGLKQWNKETIQKYLDESILAKTKYPDFFIGFDLVQQEDANQPLEFYAPVLLKKQELEQSMGISLPYIFHGGQSLNNFSNTNIIDMILMDTKRIGHGYNLTNHAYLMEYVKENQICIEINPMSCQILRYIHDLRLHPAKLFLNYGIPICINPDDPGFFGVLGVSYDFYTLAIAQEFDLKDLKLCCYYSIKYSLANEVEKQNLMQLWLNNWQEFISKFTQQYPSAMQE
ncbi:hypothetical protein ABPG74_006181 [Tetrahymena malaccensis]